MKHLGTKRLETGRLILREFTFEDAQAMYDNWVNDDEVIKYLMWPKHSCVEDTKIVLGDWIVQYKKKDYYQWAIALKDDPMNPIGSIGVVHNDHRTKMGHIGYCISRSLWNKGITSEALAEVIKFLILEVGMNRIESRHDPRNINSGKVMMKCGMKCEGTMRQADWNNQGICDCSQYAILACDYRK